VLFDWQTKKSAQIDFGMMYGFYLTHVLPHLSQVPAQSTGELARHGLAPRWVYVAVLFSVDMDPPDGATVIERVFSPGQLSCQKINARGEKAL
jgi:hypothetical protein